MRECADARRPPRRGLSRASLQATSPTLSKSKTAFRKISPKTSYIKRSYRIQELLIFLALLDFHV